MFLSHCLPASSVFGLCSILACPCHGRVVRVKQQTGTRIGAYVWLFVILRALAPTLQSLFVCCLLAGALALSRRQSIICCSYGPETGQFQRICSGFLARMDQRRRMQYRLHSSPSEHGSYPICSTSQQICQC
ncbi:hypothetical protein C8Q77DRAFT_804594 [Trametes polyzona]|nr:hypothetical protein C8Q77DRAFT_804594 [Trametes polyzona]